MVFIACYAPNWICTENKLQLVERLGRSFLSEDKVPENLLVLSCEEDQDISIPFLERGELHIKLCKSWLYNVVHGKFRFFVSLFFSGAEEVYSSELLLNGIVTQKLEWEVGNLILQDHSSKPFVFVSDSHACLHLHLCVVSGTVSSQIMLGECGQRYGSETAKESTNAVEGKWGYVIKLTPLWKPLFYRFSSIDLIRKWLYM